MRKDSPFSALARALSSKSSLYLMATFYFIAGCNHFVHPEFYLGLIPDYLPYHRVINSLSGVVEIVLAIGLLFAQFRKVASVLVILMLLAFIPSHVYFIEIGSCVSGELCVDPIIAWVRLLIIHPFLLIWAYQVGKS